MCDCWYEGYEVSGGRGSSIKYQTLFTGVQGTAVVLVLSVVLLLDLYLVLQITGTGEVSSFSSDLNISFSGRVCQDQREMCCVLPHGENYPGIDRRCHHPSC